MPRLRTKTGCSQCKTRRVKCPEQRPSCSTCLRLNLHCSYGVTTRTPPQCTPSLKILGVFDLGSPLVEAQNLPTVRFDSESDASIMALAPSAMASILVDSYDCRRYEDGSVIQIMFSDTITYHSALAGLTTGAFPQLLTAGDIRSRNWGRALSALRLGLQDARPTKAALLVLQMATRGLGSIETFGDGMSGHLDLHLKAGLRILSKHQELYGEDWSYLPTPACLMALENILYHAAVCMFMSNRETIATLWNLVQPSSVLFRLSPVDETRVQMSPTLAGQYELYEMVFKVMVLFRVRALVHKDRNWLDNAKSRIVVIEKSLSSCFKVCTWIDANRQAALESIYTMFCTCLLICIAVLKNPYCEVLHDVKSLVGEGLARFLRMPIVKLPAGNTTLAWPVQIICCAIQGEDDFQIFLQRFEVLKPLFDPGHKKRAVQLVARVSELRARPVSEGESRLRSEYGDGGMPRAMLLLRQRDGVLSSEI